MKILLFDAPITCWHNSISWIENRIMPDNKPQQELTAEEQEFEVLYLSHQLEVSKEEVLAAMEAVGCDRCDVEAYIRKS